MSLIELERAPSSTTMLPEEMRGRQPTASHAERQPVRLRGRGLECDDDVSACPDWAARGECVTNAAFMRTRCALSCDTCEEAFERMRLCHRPAAKQPAVRPGGISRIFQRMIQIPHSLGSRVEVLSRPPAGPWILSIDGFLSPTEASTLAALGDGTRTQSSSDDSETAWCTEPSCESHPLVVRLQQRVENATLIPTSNSEHLQLLHFKNGASQAPSHDQNAAITSPWGPRLLTFLIYLTDVPEDAGGGTRFSAINLTVSPRAGRALVWPSVRDDDPSVSDRRTVHEALPVTSNGAMKLAANLRIHQFDFRGPFAAGCTNDDVAELDPGAPCLGAGCYDVPDRDPHGLPADHVATSGGESRLREASKGTFPSSWDSNDSDSEDLSDVEALLDGIALPQVVQQVSKT